MDSGPKRNFDRVIDEGVRRKFIDQPTRDHIAELWQLHRWKKGVGGFYQALVFLSVLGVIISCVMGMRRLAEAESLMAWLKAGVEQVFKGLAYVSGLLGECLEFILRGIVWVLRGLVHVVQAVLEYVVIAARYVGAFFEWLGGWIVIAATAVWEFLRSTFGGAASWLYDTAAAALGFLYGVLATVALSLYSAAGTVFGFLYGVAATVFGFLYGILSTVAGYLYGVAKTVFGLLYDIIATAANFIYGAAVTALGFLYGCLAGAAVWLYAFFGNLWHDITWWYWLSVASEWKVMALFAASMLFDFVAGKMAVHPRCARYARYAYIFEAALFSWMLGHIVELYAIHYWWEGLEIASAGMWCVLPLFIAVMTGLRPLLHEVLAFAVLAVHVLAYTNGVTGNVIVAFDVSLAVMIIAGADIFKTRLGPHAPVVRYTAMGVLSFILYCSGFVWDLPAVLEFRGYSDPSALPLSRHFLVFIIAAAVLLVGLSYWRKGKVRTRNDGVFSLLLLLTLLFAGYSTGILLHSFSVGEIYDLTGPRYNLSIFAGNVLLATLFAWAAWFLWCLWLLVESSDLNNGIMAQIAVTALLGSLETRYVEVVKNISLLAGTMILPLMLILILIAIRIIRRWLGSLESAPAPVVSVEG